MIEVAEKVFCPFIRQNSFLISAYRAPDRADCEKHCLCPPAATNLPPERFPQKQTKAGARRQ